MIITKGCSQCRSETDHCDECSEQIRLEISHTPPNRSGEIVIDFEYTNSKGETVTVSDWKKLRGGSTVSFRQQCVISWNNHALLPKDYLDGGIASLTHSAISGLPSSWVS